MANRITAAQVCDARDDDSSNTDDNIINTTTDLLAYPQYVCIWYFV